NIGPTIVVEIGSEYAETVSAVGVGDAGSLRNIPEGGVAVGVEQDVRGAIHAWRTASDHHAFVQAGPGLGHGSGGQIHVDVVGDEKIKLAIAIVIDESATGVPALAVGGDTGPGGDIGKRAVAIVVVEDIVAEVGDKQIVETVVVV